MALALAILAAASAKAVAPAPPPDFEWSSVYFPAPPPIVPVPTGSLPPIEITPDNVELIGAGELALKPDLAALEADLAESKGYRISRIVRLSFDRAGVLTGCEPFYDFIEKTKSEALCKAIGSAATFNFAPGFAQPLTRGYVRTWISYQPRIEPRLPVRFRPRDKGAAVEFWMDDAGGCSAIFPALNAAQVATLCKAIAANAVSRKARQAYRASGAGSGGHSRLRFWVDTVPLPLEKRIDVKIESTPDRIGKRIVYPQRSATEPAMPLSYGTFALSITQADRPEQTRRWTSVAPSTVLLGIGADGSVQSCRPVASSGGSWLDNHACVLAAAKGRFTWTAGVPTTPMRYVSWTADWTALPPPL